MKKIKKKQNFLKEKIDKLKEKISKYQNNKGNNSYGYYSEQVEIKNKENQNLKREIYSRSIEIRDCQENIIDLENQIHNLKSIISKKLNFDENSSKYMSKPISVMNDNDQDISLLREKYEKNSKVDDFSCKNSCLM